MDCSDSKETVASGGQERAARALGQLPKCRYYTTTLGFYSKAKCPSLY